MRPIDHIQLSFVGAPANRVFALLTDPATIPRWLPDCAAVEAKGPVRKGARLKVRFGQRLTDFEIVDFNPDKTFGWVERGARQGAKTFFRLENAGGAPAITMKSVWQPHGFGAWVRGRLFPKRNVQRMLDGTVNNLRVLVMK